MAVNSSIPLQHRAVSLFMSKPLNIEDLVTAVIVTFNSDAVVGTCLQALPQRLKAIIADNASTDGTLTTVAQTRPETEVVQMGRNAGYGSAANAGFAKVTTPYGLLVNPDAKVPAKAIEALLTALLEDETAGIAGPHLVQADGTPERGFDAALAVREKWPKDRRHTSIVADGPCCADFLSGAVMLFRMDAFHQVSGFDEDLFLYYEDDDICFRMRRAGFSLLHSPSAVCQHLSGQSSGTAPTLSTFKEEAMTRSRLIFTAKTQGISQAKARAKDIVKRAWPRTIWYRLLGRRYKSRIEAARLNAARRFLQGQDR